MDTEEEEDQEKETNKENSSDDDCKGSEDSGKDKKQAGRNGKRNSYTDQRRTSEKDKKIEMENISEESNEKNSSDEEYRNFVDNGKDKKQTEQNKQRNNCTDQRKTSEKEKKNRMETDEKINGDEDCRSSEDSDKDKNRTRRNEKIKSYTDKRMTTQEEKKINKESEEDSKISEDSDKDKKQTRRNEKRNSYTDRRRTTQNKKKMEMETVEKNSSDESYKSSEDNDKDKKQTRQNEKRNSYRDQRQSTQKKKIEMVTVKSEEEDQEEVTVKSEEEDQEEVTVVRKQENRIPKVEGNSFQENGRRSLRKRLVQINYANTEESEEESEDNYHKDEDYRSSDDSDDTQRYTGRKKSKKKSSDDSSDEDYSSSEDSDGDERRKNKNRKRGRRKGSDSSNEDSRSSENSDGDGRRKIKSHERGRRKTTKEAVVKSEYEMMIDKNRAERMAFLQSLQLDEAKEGLMEVMDKVKKKRQIGKRIPKPRSSSPPRKSGRLSNVNINFSEDVLYDKALAEAKAEIQTAQAEKNVETLPTELTFEKALESEDAYVKMDYFQDSKLETNVLDYNKCLVMSMDQKQLALMQVVPNKLSAMTWYPTAENLISVAGDYDGYLGIWNIDKSRHHLFKTHADEITCLQFSPLNHVQLLSSSEDGTLRCSDMVQEVSTEIYNDSNASGCKWFDILSESTYLVCLRNGQVVLVDRRCSKRTYAKKYYCHDSSLTTVNIHPVQKDYFVTAGVKGHLCLWDLRTTLRKPVVNMTFPHQKNTTCAFFSPITGNSLLVATNDNFLNIFNTSKMGIGISLKKVKKYNIRQSTALWLPNSDTLFCICSPDYPRKINVFDKNLSSVGSVTHKDFNSFSSINLFHPYTPALATGGKVTGRIGVFFEVL